MIEKWNCNWNTESSEALLYGVFEYFYSYKFHPNINETVTKQWNNFYIFDSFHFKNLIDMNNAESGAKILNAPYCIGNEQDKCAKNLVVSL
jgi:hypothetical protein